MNFYEENKVDFVKKERVVQLKVAICDDDEMIRSEIKRILVEIKPNYEIYTFSSGEEFLESSESFQIIFLDIEMKEMDGLETAEALRKKENDAQIIFITSHTECMPTAFKVRAFRFLNKPIEVEAFKEAVFEAEKEIIKNKSIIIDAEGQVRIVSIKDIIYFEAFGDGTYIYLKNEVIESNKQLKYWVDKMEKDLFFPVHRSYMVALFYVKGVEKNEITMKYAKEKIPLARRKAVTFKEALVEYVRRYARYI